MYGCNLFMWKSTRINYNFIFEFSPSTALKYRDAFLVCTTFMTAVVGAMVVHLILRASGFSPSQVDAIPGILLLVSPVTDKSDNILKDTSNISTCTSRYKWEFSCVLTLSCNLQVFIALLICPFDIFYRPTRYCFIRVIRNIVCSPFYKVHLLFYEHSGMTGDEF